MKANSNLALIKYWGKLSPYQLPMNPSFSMELNQCVSDVEALEIDSSSHEVEFNGGKEKILQHLQLLDRYLIEIQGLKPKCFKFNCKNNFPTSAGIASSASGMAALTKEYLRAYGINAPDFHLVNLARLGSGSASRSILGFDFCSWEVINAQPRTLVDELEATKVTEVKSSILLDSVVVMFDTEEKILSSSLGHQLMDCHPMKKSRIVNVHKRYDQCVRAFQDGNLEEVIPVIETESMEMHGLMLSCMPPLLYLNPKSVLFIHDLLKWRNDKPCFFSIDAGANIHCVFSREIYPDVENFLGDRTYIKTRFYK